MPDVAPTILDFCGVSPGRLVFDGRSAADLVKSPGDPEVVAGWRDVFLVEYLATEAGAKLDSFGHVVDSGNNTFRGLRVRNKEHDLAYFEFTDDYTDWNASAPTFFELFDVARDPNQIHNIYHEAPQTLQAGLAQRLREEYGCRGAACA